VFGANVIRVAAVVLRDAAGRIATVRKHNTQRFMLPGGKPEPGETYAQTAVRESLEELDLALDPESLRLLGVFRAPAANEPGYECEETLFGYDQVVSLGEPHAEIAETRWLDPTAPLPADSAPLLVKVVDDLPGRRGIRAVTCYAGSAIGDDPSYAAAVADLAATLAQRGVRTVCGGGKAGLMGVLADAALAAGGRVTGVLPQTLVGGGTAHTGLTALEVVPDMPERKARMSALGDAMVALPGGAGTLEEFFEAWTCQQLGVHAKPVALYNPHGFWDSLVAVIRWLVETGFLSRIYAEALIVADTPEGLIEALTTWQPPAAKWQDRP
jgi:uncharacterized protein (TIGR00730 family)